jgi:transcriptional regulator
VYIPAHFREDDVALLHDVIRNYSFATLVTLHEQQPFASHLPFLLDAERGPHGTLRGHLARANPQWQSFDTEQEALVLFEGPHAYISPSWYETHPSVPTWNYIAVHAYGVPRLVDDTTLYTLLQDLVHTYEAGRAAPWKLDLPDDYLQKMMRAIVGFEIEITRLEGKFKLSQNRPQGDREHVIAALCETTDPLQVELAAWMRRHGPV